MAGVFADVRVGAPAPGPKAARAAAEVQQTQQQAQQLQPPAGKPLGTFLLDNGLELSYATNPDEVRHLWKEIFTDRLYLQHGIELAPGAGTVIDVGANCGIFSIQAAGLLGAAGRVVALEPAPRTAAAAAANVASHARWAGGGGGAPPAAVEVMQAGAGDGAARTLTLSIYDNQSTLASVDPNHDAAHTALATYIETCLKEAKPAGSLLERQLMRLGSLFIRSRLTAPLVRGAVAAYVAATLAARTEVEVDMVTVSGVIRDKGITKVTLLKVDVERSELAVLRGVAAEDWHKIDQTAIEVHESFLPEVLQLLKTTAAYTHIVCEAADPSIGPHMHNVWATRKQA